MSCVPCADLQCFQTKSLVPVGHTSLLHANCHTSRGLVYELRLGSLCGIYRHSRWMVRRVGTQELLRTANLEGSGARWFFLFFPFPAGEVTFGDVICQRDA